MQTKRTPEGIRIRHSRTCATRDGGKCDCQPSYEASVYSKRDNRKIRKTFGHESEAKLWRADALIQLDRGAMRAPKATTVAEAWATWLAGAEAGTIHPAGRECYKPSAIRAYREGMRLRVLPEFGAARLADLTRPDLQDYVERLTAEGHGASTVQVTFLPLRAIYKRAIARGDLAINPCSGLHMPTSNNRRERFADPCEAEALIKAVPECDRALWATALYSGLRRGELQALRWDAVDLAGGLIRVRHGWDEQEGQIDLKTSSALRKVPIIPVLRDHLIDHKLRTGRAEGYVFGPDAERVFNPRTVTNRADTAWEAAGLDRITLHECRHTFASLMIAAGVNTKALSTFMGHAKISITLDRYGHLMPGSEAEAAQLLDSYLTVQREQAEEKAREALTGASTGRTDLICSPEGR